MKTLILSDTVVSLIHSSQIKEVCEGVEMVLCCGDLPNDYIEYVVSMLDVPVYHVHGNHSEYTKDVISPWETVGPPGTIDLHRKVIRTRGLLIAGIEGCNWYRPGPFQYSQNEMRWFVYGLIPSLIWNRLRYGRYLDIFVSHAPPAGVHDDDDLAHQGISAFRWLIETFQPHYHFHGHVHVYRQDIQTITPLGRTQVINTYGYRLIDLEFDCDTIP